ncbi:MAG: thiamine phosphate synthase [Pseudomonadota bacterium]
MSSAVETKLYLISPPTVDLGAFAEALAEALSAGPVACVRLRLSTGDTAEWTAAVKKLLPLCHAQDVPLLVSDHYKLAAELGLDGVHLETNGSALKDAREAMDRDAIIGVSCGVSRHWGMIAGERAADYVSFGPITADSLLQTGELADKSLFEWWQTMIEIPVVAEGGVTEDGAAALAGIADFVAVSDGVWSAPDGPAAAVRRFLKALEEATTAHSHKA